MAKDAYAEIEQALRKCEEAITKINKASPRDKVKLARTRREHNDLKQQLAHTPKGVVEDKKDSKSKIQDKPTESTSDKKDDDDDF